MIQLVKGVGNKMGFKIAIERERGVEKYNIQGERERERRI